MMSSKKVSPKISVRPATGKTAAAKSSTGKAAVVPASVINASTSYAGIAIKPPPYDPMAAKGLLDTFRPRLEAIPAEKLAVPRLAVRDASLAALGVYAFVTQVVAVYERFKKLHQIGEFNIANIEDLKAAAFLVLYAHTQAEAAGAFQTDVKVPAKLAQEAAEVEKRMQALCEYKFKRDPEIAPLLALLSPGTGYGDIAGDLFGYADIYDMRPAEVPLDTTNYRPTDAAGARRIAGEIMAHLSAGMSPKARDAYELMKRAWTLLLQIYFEVREVGLCLLRHDPRRNEWLPSLFAAGRTGRPRKKKAEEVGTG